MNENLSVRDRWYRKVGGIPELIAGVLLPIFAFAESNWSALFFFFAVSGLVSIGTMGAIAPRAVRQQITPGE